MPCMGPSTGHIEPEAEAFTQAIIKVLENHDIRRPTKFGVKIKPNIINDRLNAQWDAEVVKLKACIKELMSIDAAATF